VSIEYFCREFADVIMFSPDIFERRRMMLIMPKFLRKFLARIGCPTMAYPSKDWPEEEKKKDESGLMVYHYCRWCKKYHWDHVVNWLSKSEYFICGNCASIYKSDHLFGISFFYISECARVAEEHKKNRFVLFFFGFEKYYPDDRGGKTAADLEVRAFWSVLPFMFPMDPGRFGKDLKK
jgi:hypothetical protein